MRSKIVLLSILGVALLLPAPVTAHGFRGRGFGGGWGFRGGHFRGGHIGFSFGRSYYRPFFRHYSYPSYYGYSYPSFGFYGSFGSSYWPGYYSSPSYVYYSTPSYVYVPSYPVAAEREVVRDRERDPDEYREPVRSTRAERYWLVAFKDKTIQAVTDYWMEGSTLHYVSRDGTKSSSDLANVDVPFTKQLNLERGLEFRLPGSNGYQPRRLDSFGRPQYQ